MGKGVLHNGLHPIEAQAAVNELCDYLLGKDWYTADPLCNMQVNALIIDEIKAKYPPADGGFKARLKWRLRLDEKAK